MHFAHSGLFFHDSSCMHVSLTQYMGCQFENSKIDQIRDY